MVKSLWPNLSTSNFFPPYGVQIFYSIRGNLTKNIFRISLEISPINYKLICESFGQKLKLTQKIKRPKELKFAQKYEIVQIKVLL